MNSLTYDFHIHSCLSPCADDDMTPCNIIGMAVLKELDVIALTDHNSCKNCPAFMKIAENYDLIAIPGMELCTSEEVHVLCLFKDLESAMKFDSYVSSHLLYFPNNELIFGNQFILNEQDKIIGIEQNLLINATDISFSDVSALVREYHGIIIPAHIDKQSNSLISNLGFVPPDSDFTCVELKDTANLHNLRHLNQHLDHCKIITDSDAHSLGDISEPIHYLYTKGKTIEDIFDALT